MSPRPARTLLTLLGLALLLACDDAAVDPFGPPGAALAEGVLRQAAVPTLPTLAERFGQDAATLDHARALWLEAAGTADTALAAQLRTEARRLAAPALAAATRPAERTAVREAMVAWVEAASGMIFPADPFGVQGLLERANAELAAAATLEGDRPEAAVEALLRASDLLVHTTPPAVAERLVEQVEAGLASRSAARPEPQDEVAFQRTVRLVRGAREALDAGDYAVAIRRAYYARQLLER